MGKDYAVDRGSLTVRGDSFQITGKDSRVVVTEDIEEGEKPEAVVNIPDVLVLIGVAKKYCKEQRISMLTRGPRRTPAESRSSSRASKKKVASRNKKTGKPAVTKPRDDDEDDED